MMAQPRSGLFGKLSLFRQRRSQQRARRISRYSARTALRLESLEQRTVMHGAHIDLAAESDLGFLDNDDITSATEWTIQGSDLTVGAALRLMHGTTELATGTAISSTFNFNINVSSLADGVIELSIEQDTGSGFVPAEHTLSITKDTSLAAFTSTPPASLVIGTNLNYNAEHGEEGAGSALYSLVGAPGAASIDATTGVVTWTPAEADIGTPSFGIKITDAAGNELTQTINLTVEPTAPGVPDLTDDSDTGANQDNVTGATTLKFTVTGVLATADTVNLKIGNTIIGTEPGNGTSTVEVEVTNLGALTQGQNQITAEQIVEGIASDVSGALTITYDTQIAALSSTPPTTATVDALLTYNAEHGEENNAGFVFSLENEPSGVTINADTGVLTWTPTGAQIGDHTFQIRVTDLAGNTTTQSLTIDVSAAPPPAAPGVPNLVDASDSGAADDDNVTGAGTLTFAVGGILATADTVNLKINGVIVGTATATGASTINVSITNPAALAQGQHQITAEQIVDGVASEVSGALTFTYDTQIAAISSTPPTAATVGTQLSYNAGHPEETQLGFVYSLESAPTGVSIDPGTGVLTWTPQAGQIGVNAFKIRVTDLAGNTTTQDLSITVTATAPPAPNAPDLQAASDLGSSSTDNITSATSWVFDVSGVTSGATVNLKHNGNVVATGTATGTTISLTISNVAQFADGDVSLTAEQVVNSVASTASPAIVVKKDTTLAAVTSTPPLNATAGVAFTYDAQHADENQTGFVYSLVNAPTGMTINATTGVVAWTPSAANQVGLASFGVRVTDLAGNVQTQNVNLEVYRPLPALDSHSHADLSIFVNGVLVAIPNNIGRTGNELTNIVHTHDPDNRIHWHAVTGQTVTAPVTLGQFFTVWRTDADDAGNNPNATFSSTQLMGNTAVPGTSVVRMYVNGKINTEFENYVMRDEDDIVLTFETVGAAPTGPTLAPIQNVTVQAGAPLYIPLLGFDPTGQPITFSATASNPSLLTTGISTTNRSMRVSVAGFGDMVFELFEDKAGAITSKIIQIIQNNGYDNTIFHRVINGFMIQGGDPNGNGSNDEGQAEFDDFFHVDLQHTSSGLLSMAKAGDDTNTSQFFITDTATRFLDFNHSIFGRLTEGDNVRELISNVATNSSDKPLTNVTISNVEVFLDQENGVLMLKAAHGATGTSNVTVTATDADGNTFQQTFAVTVQADATNTPPFLGPVNDVSTPAGTAVNVQLTSTDIENGAVFYAIDPNSIDGTTKPYTATINSTTGLATITPNAGFTGTFNITFGVRQNPTISGISDQWDTQTITVTVTAGTPAAPDLLDVSDTGVSQSDNITRAGSWQFQINNVTNGATVRLFAGNGTTPVGTATASGSSVIISIDSSVFQDGAVELTAEQTTGSGSSAVTSPRSLPITVTKDTVAPIAFDFSTPLPTTAIAGAAYSYNFVNAEEGAAGYVYSLVGTVPTGATINASTGQLTWTPTASQVGAHAFTVRLSDPAGNTRDHAANISVISSETQLVQFFIRITDLSGNVITQIEEGEDFLVTVRVRDEQATPQGVFAAFADMTYDSAKVSAIAPITFGDSFPNSRSGSLTTPGIVDEAGGVAGITGLGSGLFNVYTVRFTANALGLASFATNPADGAGKEVLLINIGAVIPNTQVTHAAASLTIVAATGAVPDELTIAEDSSNNTLNVLANDTLPDGVSGPLTISAVTQPTTGGTVSIANDNLTLIFTPTANFSGNTSFTYTVTNGAGFTDTTTVNLTVTNSNDPPTAVDDNLTINEDQANAPLNVLANDTSLPDPSETLTITAVTQPTSGGTVTIAADGKSLIFNPTANFNGNVTFTYTINDGTAGSNDTATVNLTITAVNDNPTATADAQTVAEDAAATTIDVLANDSFAPDVGETLTITAVTQGSNGGTVTIGANGLTLTYKPAANFNGTETFTYTINDGNSGTATATVTMTVTAVNDPPNANDDTATTNKGAGPITINVLANDTAAPDTGETLTITAVTQPTSGGTITIASDGKSVLYTPTANFSGTVTFTYTINDGTSGSNDTASVTITVQDFLPSSITGFVYIDANKNGRRDPGEAGLAGVTVTLAGTTTGNITVNTPVQTLADGSYTFNNVAPGTYTVTETQPQFMVDGVEFLGAFGGTISANDRFSFTLPENSHLNTYNFAEMGREARFVSMRDFLTSTPMNGSLLSVNSSGAVTWVQTGGAGFAPNTVITGSLNTAKTELTLNINENGQQSTATISMSDTSKIQQLGNTNGALLLRMFGTRSSLGFTPVTTSGSGEPDVESIVSPASSSAASSSTPAPVANESDDPEGDGSGSGGGELPGPAGEAPEFDSFAAAAFNSSFGSSAPAASPQLTTTSFVGPLLPPAPTSSAPLGNFTSSSPASSTPLYDDVGSDSSSLLPALDDDMPDGDQPEKQEDETVPTLAAAPAHDRVIEEIEDESYSWLDGLSEDDDDEEHPEGSGEEAVDEVLAEDAWQA